MKKRLKFYIASFMLVIFGVSYLLAYFFITKRYEQIIYKELQSSARILAQQILLTRKWVALHSFVLVEKDRESQLNPFLEEPYIIDKKGRIFIKMNPAYVTREIAKLAEKEKGFYFRVVSLKAINPKNTPDDFEKIAILDFEKNDSKERFVIADKTFRYIIPLYTEESCLKCHEGYKVGDVRGALSIFLPSDQLFLNLKKTKFLFFLILTIFHVVVFSGFWLFFDNFVIKPVQQLSIFAENKGNISEDKFKIKELYILFQKLKSAKVKDEEIKKMLKEEVEKATNELKAINEKKSEFLLEIGHKLKTPLTVISASIDYLLMRKSCVEDEKYLELLKKNVAILKRSLDQILKTARIDMDIRDEVFEKINLSKILQEVISSFNLEKRFIDIEEDLFIYGAKEKIMLMFENLIHNAVKFNKPEGKITITLEKNKNFAVFTISDEGIGIKETDLPNIFDKFYTKNYNGKEKGTGLGLYIVKRIIEMHNGEIDLKSIEGVGTTFIVKLPLWGEKNG